ncbi:hypothetical protein ACVWZA_003979 [Sphingomonas sp. UYAg733]
MIGRRTLVGVMLASLSLIAAAPAGSDKDSAAYRVRLAVTPAADAPAQRLTLPAEVLAVLQTADASDVRLFDASGRMLPIARAEADAPAERRDELKALPILGAPDALKVSGIALSLDRDGRARVVRLDDAADDRTTGAVVLGALLDARTIAGNTKSLTLEADLPAGQPITFTVAASGDLKTWRQIGEQVIYRTPNAAFAGTELTLSDATLERDYLRVTWRADSRLLSPVTVRGATLRTRSGLADAGATIDATLPPISDVHVIDVALPFATPLSAITVVPAGDDLVVPVRILGRNDREQPWTPLGEGVASKSAPGAIALNGPAFHTLRIEADGKTAGFTASPTLRLTFASRALVFLVAGKPPFTLAAGRAGTADAYLPLESLTPKPADKLPIATIAASTGPALSLAPVDDSGATGRKTMLWVILLVATALLAGMAWLLWKRSATPQAV